jgi:two-component system, sensor histidine kinase and response regulator
MKLRWKVPLIIGATFICAILLLYFAWQKILLDVFLQTETQEVEDHLARVNSALYREIEGIDTSCSDWANWDDSYNFIQGKKPDYVPANLTPNAFATLNLDIVVFADNQGKIFYARSYNRAQETLVPLSPELASYLLNEDKLLQPGNEVINGVCAEPTPILFASRPILDSNAKGPAQGRIFFGRYLSEQELGPMADLLLLKLSLITLPEVRGHKQLESIFSPLSQGQYAVVQPVGKNEINGYILEKDFENHPAFIFKITTPRQIYARARIAQLSSLMALVIFGVLSLLLGTWFLRRVLLSRLADLGSTLREIASRKSASARVSVAGKDELANLGRDINTMLAALEHSEMERLKSEEKLRNMVEVASDWIWEVDAQGRYIYASGQVAGILGYAPAEILGKTPFDFMPSGEAWRVRKIFHQIAAERKPITFLENINLHKEGHQVVLETNGVPVFSESGEFQGYVGMDRDITQRRNAEEALRQARDESERINRELEQTNLLLQKAIQDANQMAVEAEAANAAKSAFLANMSHEIRTPMNVILGMTDLALQTKMTGEQRDFLGEVKHSADALLELINDILDLSKIEAGKLHIESVPLELREAVGDAVKIMAVKAHQKNLELICHINPEVPDFLLGDPFRLRQIILNLTGNAIKFTEAGEVAVQVEVVTRAERQVFLHFTVRDTGIGIPQHKQREIFEAFTQADGSTTRKYGGTGLGLTISSQLVRMMGGQLWVESTPGQGSTFHFTGRFGLQHASALKPVAPWQDLLGLPVLIVDDNPSNRRILEKILVHWRMQPVSAAGATQALAEIAEAGKEGRNFALILMDANMPEMDGLELAKAISRLPLPDTRIILLTSSGQLEQSTYYRALGIVACLSKPVKEADLLKTITRAMNGQSLEEADEAAKPEVALAQETSHTILLAEDNLPTQKLMLRLLEKKGYQVVIANNGREAVAHYEKETFDLILMDAQMPEMDGFQATAAIRGQERAKGGHIPIIALTAHAMQGDRERCLAGGMDSYVSKPVNPGELFAAMDSLLLGGKVSGSLNVSEAAALPVLDQAELLARVDGDLALLKELAGEFLDDCPARLAEIEQAVTSRDAKDLERLAHKFRGLAGTFAAKAAAQAAEQLEIIGHKADFAQAEAAFAALTKAVALLKPELLPLSKGKPVSISVES